MLKIYGVPVSVHTRKVIVTASEKKLPFELEPVIPFQPPANWNSLSPTGLIPAIQDGDFVLADSAAICAYLERVHPEQSIYPKDPQSYGRALWFEAYAGGTLNRNVIHGLFFQKIIRPGMLNELTDTDEMDRILLHEMPKVFGYFESQLNGDYLVDGEFSIADISLTSNLINYHYLGFEVIGNRFPKLKAYFANMIRRPSFANALAAEKPVAESMGLDPSFAAEWAKAA